MTKTDKKWKFIVNFLYLAILVGILYVVITRFFSILLPFLIAMCVAMMLQRPINAITKKTPLKRGPVSAISVSLLCILLLGVLFLLGFYAVVKLRGFAAFLGEKMNNFPELVREIEAWVLSLVARLPERFSTTMSGSVAAFFENIAENGLTSIPMDSSGFQWSSLISKGGDILIGTVGQVPTLIIACVITVIASVFITSDYDRIRAFILHQLSDDGCAKIIRAKQLCVSTVLKMVKAYGIIFLITTLELSIAFYILRFIGVYNSDYLFIIAVLIAVVDIIPVLGTGTVLIPWGIISLLGDKIGLGIGLLVTYAVILVIRQILEPKLVAGQVGLPPIVTIVSMYVGTKTLGVLGFFILPFLVILVAELNKAGVIHFFKNMHDDTPAQEEPPPQSAADDTLPPPAPAPE